MFLAELSNASSLVASTSSRTAKIEILAGVLVQAGAAGRESVELVASYLMGELPQGRIGVGWATFSSAAVVPAAASTLQVTDVDRWIDQLEGLTGPGSQRARADRVADFLALATAEEADFVRRLVLGDLGQGALEGVLVSAVAKAADLPLALVRRATMLQGHLGPVAAIALTDGAAGLRAIGLEVGRPLQPMLASTAATVGEAIDAGSDRAADVSVEWKLDGARVLVHRNGEEVAIHTRSLNEVTARLPSVVAAVRALPVRSIILDGESVGLEPDGSAQRFQETMSSLGSEAESGHIVAQFFDILHLDGRDLIDEPLSVRRSLLETVVPPASLVPALVTSDGDEAAAMLENALAAGHEGVMIKRIDSTYQAGRRNKSWRKVKPVHTLDLVVLAVEWGHGRRSGKLSNLHLGARADDGNGFVMLGKTFKGLTDELLAWQTTRFLELEEHRADHVVVVRPEQVVEVAVDGIQSSSRYPGGVALRFARVRRYRSDKTASEADTLSTVKALGH